MSTNNFKYEKGHCVMLGSFTFVILKSLNELVYLTHITDPRGRNGRWIDVNKLPTPHAKINIEC